MSDENQNSWPTNIDESEHRNASAYDAMAAKRHPLARPAKDKDLEDPLSVVDEIGWLGGNIRDWKVLCLAAGGGRHSAMYASAGAKVTVVDISEGMLELDRQVAEQRRLPMRILKASMAAMPMLVDGEFDLVVHPVSTCYVSDVRPVFTEVARVLRAGGLYISQHKQPVNLQASLEPRAGFYAIEQPLFANRPVKSPTTASRLREPGTHEYAHTLEQLLGAMCRAGMVIEDLTEPNHAKPDDPLGAFGHRCSFISPYLRVKARRVGASHSQLIL